MYIALVAVVALTACTKVDMEEIAPRKKVTFQVAGYAPMTKANTSVMSEFTSFTAKAYLYAEGYTGNNQTPQDFFGASGTTIRAYTSGNAVTTTAGSESYWAPGHDYYWPKSENSYINFIAWYDYRGVAPSTATETSLSWNNYTVQSTDNLLFADEAWRFNTNTTNAAQYDGDRVTSGVPMLFHHALAQVAFKARATQANDGNGTSWTVVIRSLTLTNVYSKASLSLTNSDPVNDNPNVTRETKAWTGSWTGYATPISLPESNTTPVHFPVTLTTTAGNLIPMRTVLPQDVTSSMVVTLSYEIHSYYNGNEVSEEDITITKNLLQLVPSITEWEMGHRITYTIEIDPSTDMIEFKPTLQNWNSSNVPITLE